MVKVTITPKVQLPGGNFFLDTDNELTYKTNDVRISNGYLLFCDRDHNLNVRHKLDCINYFYDIVTV